MRANDKGTQRMEKLSAKDLLTPIAVIIAGVLISGAILWSNKQLIDVARVAYGAEAAASPPTAAADITKVSQQGVPFIGDPKASVVMAYWFDYQCPFCRENEEKVMPRLITDYVKPGKLKILFKDFAFLGPALRRSPRSDRCSSRRRSLFLRTRASASGRLSLLLSS